MIIHYTHLELNRFHAETNKIIFKHRFRFSEQLKLLFILITLKN